MIASREDFARQAVARAAAVRDRFDVPLTAAVNVIDLCIEQYTPRILVRFKDISMEGVYLREPNPEIWIGLRPLVRRVYNCTTNSATTSSVMAQLLMSYRPKVRPLRRSLRTSTWLIRLPRTC